MRWMKDREEANWLDDTFGETFMLKFQLVHSHQTTYPHRDNNGTDTHIAPLRHGARRDVVAGRRRCARAHRRRLEIEKLKDTCDLVDWERLSQMPSGAASSCSARAMCS